MTIIEPLTGKRHEGETKQAVLACNDYLRMGPGRSIRGLDAQYASEGKRKPAHVSTLMHWSRDYSWQKRAEIYDTEIEEEKNRVVAAERKRIMETGISQDYVRMQKLQRLGDFLEGQIYQTEARRKPIHIVMAEIAAGVAAKKEVEAEKVHALEVERKVAEAEMRDGARPASWSPEDYGPLFDDEPDEDDAAQKRAGEDLGITYPNVWLHRLKTVAGMAMDEEAYNSPLIRDFLRTLDDAAKENGGRTQKTELSGPGGKPIEVRDTSADDAIASLGTLLEHASPEEQAALLQDYEEYKARSAALRKKLAAIAQGAQETNG